MSAESGLLGKDTSKTFYATFDNLSVLCLIKLTHLLSDVAAERRAPKSSLFFVGHTIIAFVNILFPSGKSNEKK